MMWLHFRLLISERFNPVAHPPALENEPRLSGDTLSRVIQFAASAPAVQIFIATMRAFDRSQLISEIRRRFAARCLGRNRND